MDTALDLKASILAEKVKHYLVTSLGCVLEDASHQEFFQAFSYALREEIIINWAACRRMIQDHNQRVIYYLSMEYLPGRILSNNITNLQSHELVNMVLRKLGRDYRTVVRCEGDPGLGNGGLGRLASCFLDSMATLQYPSMGYGLRYQYGIFEQELWDGVQIERPDPWLLTGNPWQDRRDFDAQVVKYCGHLAPRLNQWQEEVYDIQHSEEVRALPYDIPILGYCKDRNFSVVTLRLWSTKESPRNFELQQYNAGRLDQASENLTLSDVLYPNDVHETGKRIRLKQEFLLVSASTQDILNRYAVNRPDLEGLADKVRIQINDTHPAMVIPEMIRLLVRQHEKCFDEALEITQAITGFTQHTVLREALEEWDQNLFQYLLPRQYRVIERINAVLCDKVRKKFPNDEGKIHRLSILENGQVRMAHLAVFGSHKINGVAHLHTEILKADVFKDFYDLSPEKFVNITNGVTQRRWLLHCNPELATFITSHIGDGWITDFSQIRRLAEFASDPSAQQEFLEIKKRRKEQLAQLIALHNPVRDQTGKIKSVSVTCDPDSLFDVHIKRIHEYKRQLMNLLHTIILYQELKENPNARPISRTVIFAGKAASGYRMAKNIIRLAHCISRKVNADPDVSHKLKVIFIENYNVSRAEIIIPAADLSQQISTAGFEASGTGNMKLSINGALTIGTEDGANIEMRQQVGDQWWPFRFGCSAEEIQELQHPGGYSSWDVVSQDPILHRAVETLRDHTFAESEDEHAALLDIYASLFEGSWGSAPDHYFVLKDMQDYAATQRKVENLFVDRMRWAKHALMNIAGMGAFSADRSIQEYGQQIWGTQSLPIDPMMLARLREEYAEHAPTLML